MANFARGVDRPETMGAVCAVVYLLVLICFIPFPFYKDIVAATSGGGNKDLVVQASRQHVEMGRFLHRFPHSKVSQPLSLSVMTGDGEWGSGKRKKGTDVGHVLVGFVSRRDTLVTVGRHTGYRRRFVRHTMEA